MAVVVTTLVAAAVYLSWLSGAARVGKLTATAAWLIPGVNLVAPMVLADQAWRERGKDAAPALAPAAGRLVGRPA